MTLRGTSVRRREDEPLLRGSGNYVAGVHLENAAQVYYLVSTIAHAEILSVDVTYALLAPGVIDVVLHKDLDIGPYPAGNPIFDEAMVRPLLADQRVRYVG